MTDYRHPSQAHPTPDELADLRADALEPGRAAEVSAHVRDCSSCADDVAAIDAVREILADAGQESIVMPDEISASLDAALARASAERSAGVPSLDERRVRTKTTAVGSSDKPRRDTSRWMGGLGAAAAVVVFVIAGGVLLDRTNTGSGSDDSAGSGTAAEDAGGAVEGPADGGSAGDHLTRLAPQRVTAGELETFARSLSRHADKTPLATSEPDAQRLQEAQSYDVATCPAPTLGGRGVLRIPIRFEGRLAYVEVNRETREAVVYSCDTPPERLSATSY